MNAVLARDASPAHWHLGRHSASARPSSSTTLFAEGALLFVAAQTGFIDGPRVMANMAVDSWLPHRFAALSDRLTMQNGVLLMGGAAGVGARSTRTATSRRWSSCTRSTSSSPSRCRSRRWRSFWISHRAEHRDWARHLPIHVIGFLLCVAILAVTVVEKFARGRLADAGDHRHRRGAVRLRSARTTDTCGARLSHLDKLFARPAASTRASRGAAAAVDPTQPTAVLLVGGYGGLGVHSVLTLLRMFPNHFTNIVFISVGVIDSGNFKGAEEVERAQGADPRRRSTSTSRWRGAWGWRPTSAWRSAPTWSRRPRSCACRSRKEYPHVMFFSGKLIFEQRRWYPPAPAQRDRVRHPAPAAVRRPSRW